MYGIRTGTDNDGLARCPHCVRRWRSAIKALLAKVIARAGQREKRDLLLTTLISKRPDLAGKQDEEALTGLRGLADFSPKPEVEYFRAFKEALIQIVREGRKKGGVA